MAILSSDFEEKTNRHLGFEIDGAASYGFGTCMFGSPNERERVSVKGARPRARCGQWGRTQLMAVRCLSLLVSACVSLASPLASGSSPSKSKPSYNRDIRPV